MNERIKLTAAQKRYEMNLSKEDFKKAIFIDFEGFMNKPPALVGYLYDQKFVQVVFDDALKPAALAKGLPVREGKVEVANLLMLAKYEGRRIVAYTQFDKNVVFEQFGVDLSPVYADARLIAVKWLRRLKSTHPTWWKTHPNWDIEKTLKSFLELIGYDRPPHLGLEKTTSRIKHVRDQLIRWGSFEKLSPVAKAKWTKLLDHNSHDVLGMTQLVQRALDGFVPAGRLPNH